MFALDTLSQVPLSTVATFPVLYEVSTDETCTVSDPFTAQVDFSGVSSDSVSLTDEGPGSYNFFGYITDHIEYSELDEVVFNANPTTSESFTFLPEDIGSAFAFNKEVDESFTTTDAPTSNAIYANPQVDEAFTLTDEELGIRGQFANVDETMDTNTDAYSANSNFVGERNETLSTSDIYSSQVDFGPIVSDTVTTTDSFVETGWQTIDNRETSIWVRINNSQ